jgi:hypothetical protein
MLMRFIWFTTILLLSYAVSAPPVYACSKGAFWPILPDSVAYFIGNAARDTVLAGPGTVGYLPEGMGHYSRAGNRPIRGQRIRVEKLGGPATQWLASNVQEVVVVPWDYDAGCSTLPWGRSAQWDDPGTRGFYIAKLRAREHWAGGRPTFDLFNPGHLPYTATEEIRKMGRHSAVSSLLSLNQVFDLYQAFPTSAEIERQQASALARLQAWVRTHPDLARRPPAEFLLSVAVRHVTEAELATTDHPALGSWRFSLRVPGDTTYVFYGKTTSFPVARWTRSRTKPDGVEALLPPAEGYTFKVGIHRRLDALPPAAPRHDWIIIPQRHMSVMAKPDSIIGGKTYWRGSLSPELLQLPGLDDPRVRRAASVLSQSYSDYSTSGQGLAAPTPALFVLGTDGVLRVRQTIPLGAGEELIFEGEQISRQVIYTPK